MKKIVDGVEVELTPEEEAQVLAEWAMFAAEAFAKAKAKELAKFRADRELFLNRLAGIGVAAQFNNQDAVVASVVSVRQALLDLTSDVDVVAATDINGLKTAMAARYATIVGGADPALRAAFKKVDV